MVPFSTNHSPPASASQKEKPQARNRAENTFMGPFLANRPLAPCGSQKQGGQFGNSAKKTFMGPFFVSHSGPESTSRKEAINDETGQRRLLWVPFKQKKSNTARGPSQHSSSLCHKGPCASVSIPPSHRCRSTPTCATNAISPLFTRHPSPVRTKQLKPSPLCETLCSPLCLCVLNPDSKFHKTTPTSPVPDSNHPFHPFTIYHLPTSTTNQAQNI